MRPTARAWVVGAGLAAIVGTGWWRLPQGPALTEPWTASLAAVERALERKDLSAAERAWRDAYGAARAARHWQALAEVGDAAVRIGASAALRAPYRERARRAYLAALFDARARGDVAGVLRSAEAFAGLGDRDAALVALRVAQGLAEPGDGAARSRLAALAELLADRSVAWVDW